MTLTAQFADSFDPGEVAALRDAFEMTCSALARDEWVGEARRNEVAERIIALARRAAALDSGKLATMAVTGISPSYNLLRSVVLPSR
jgi:hypothetical protein